MYISGEVSNLQIKLDMFFLNSRVDLLHSVAFFGRRFQGSKIKIRVF